MIRFRYLYRRCFEKKYKELSEAAYHEAGHVYISYSVGYKVDNVSIFPETPGDGRTRTDFQPIVDKHIALLEFNKILIFNNTRSTSDIDECVSIAQKIIEIIVAGSIAQSKFETLRDKRRVVIDIFGRDKTNLVNVEQSLGYIQTYTPSSQQINSTKFIVEKISYLIAKKQTWKTIDHIAKDILNSKEYSLDGQMIERILKNT